MQKMLAKFESRGAFLFNSIPEILVRKQIKQTILIWFCQNILTTPLKVVHFGLSYWYDRNDPFHALNSS